MKPKIAGEHVSVDMTDLRKLVPYPLTERDKTFFWMHVTEIEKMNRENWPKDWEWKKVLIKNYCRRTGVNYHDLMKYVTGKFWLHIQQALIENKMA